MFNYVNALIEINHYQPNGTFLPLILPTFNDACLANDLNSNENIYLNENIVCRIASK